MRTAALWTLILLLGITVQKVLISGLMFTNFKPDLILLIVVSAGLLGGKDTGLGVGFFAGLVQDLASGNVLGLNIFSKMAVGFLGGFLESRVFKENVFLPVFMAVAATFLNGLIICIFVYVLGYAPNLWLFISNQFVPSAVVNLIIAIPLHQAIYRLIYKMK
ncbi:MAG: rod shape-determining protein MreD [Sporomusaceae bacterium]|jgi:rod shape-determining protein MreD|nr:rod shape-determining protein MreD [Sporomusaceae bacterium]